MIPSLWPEFSAQFYSVVGAYLCFTRSSLAVNRRPLYTHALVLHRNRSGLLKRTPATRQGRHDIQQQVGHTLRPAYLGSEGSPDRVEHQQRKLKSAVD